MTKLILLLCIFFVLVPQVSAQSVNVSAYVGKYYFSVSGYVSPFASIVMSSNSIFMASTVADPKGNFSMQRVLVNEGFSEFCLEAIDVKRIGDSYTCFKIPGVYEDTEKNNIFLPPTLGLSGKKITPGSSVFGSGYTMPSANVVLNISKVIKIDDVADESGFYKDELKDIPTGKYSLFATAKYENRNSEKPSRFKELESLSVGGLIKEKFPLIILIVLLVIAALILLLILISKKLRRGLRGMITRKPIGKKKILRPLHHSWFLGY